GVAEAEVERVRVAAEGHRPAARRRQVVRQHVPVGLGRLPVVGPPEAAAGGQHVDDVRIGGVRQDGARAAAVSHVAGEAAVLLVVGAGGADAHPLRALSVLLVPVLLAFLDRVLAECRADRAPGLALPLESGGGIVLLGLAAFLLVALFGDGGHRRGVVIGRRRLLLGPAVRREAREDYY